MFETETFGPDLVRKLKWEAMAPLAPPVATHPGKSKCSTLSFYVFWWFSNWTFNKNKLYMYSDYWFRDIIIFDFLEKGLGQVSQSYLCKIFQETYSSFYILLIDQILLPDCFYFLRYQAICVL